MLQLNSRNAPSVPLILKNQSARRSYDGPARSVPPVRILPDSKPILQKQLSPSIDHFKSHISDITADLDLYETSVAADIGVDKNVYVLKTNRPSFYIKSFNTGADTADTRPSLNQSVSCMDIPNERTQHKIFTTYEDYHDIKQTIPRTEESLNVLSFKTSRSLSTQAKTRAASRYRDCSPEHKPRDFTALSSSRLSYKLSKDGMNRDLHGFSRQEDLSDKSPPTTPRLGTVCSYVNLTETKENIPIQPPKTERHRRRTLDSNSDNSRVPMSEIKNTQSELIQERECLKMTVIQLKKKIKEEETKKLEANTRAQNLKAEMEKISKKAGCREKNGLTVKNQLHNLKREVMVLLEQIDEHRANLYSVKEGIEEEQEQVTQVKEQVKDLKTYLAFETKEKDQIKGMAEKLNKSKVKTLNTYELLVRYPFFRDLITPKVAERMKYQTALEKNMLI